MRHHIKTLGLVLVLTPAVSFGAETESQIHPDVQAALTYELRINECKRPNITGQSDAHNLGRGERKLKRWKKCVKKYRKGLLKDFQGLRSSAQHGLNKEQADIILAKMGQINGLLQSPDELL